MKKVTQQQVNRSLREERLKHGWSQQDLAEQLGTTTVTISRWENGTSTPSPYFRLKLSQLFQKDAETLGLFPGTKDAPDNRVQEALLTPNTNSAPVQALTQPLRWLPYRRNPFFTGREAMLQHLHTLFQRDRATGFQSSYALTGLGGIGKTQMALEYVCRYASDYPAVFWIGAETHESLIASLVSIADLLQLFEHPEQDQNKIVAAVTRWLTMHHDWLAVLDNVEDLELVKGLFPSSGSLLLTTRLQMLGTFAQRINLEQMTSEEGLCFLLRRVGHLREKPSLETMPQRERLAATEIVERLGGLPLALDQARAYMDELQCSFADYLQLLQTHTNALLAERGRETDHPFSTVKTITMAFETIQSNHPAAATLLLFCCFLAPDAIPEEILRAYATHFGLEGQATEFDQLQLNNALKALHAYSLLHRNKDTETLTLHRLVQAVLIGQMDEETQMLWAGRVVRIVNPVFLTERMNVQQWARCELLLPHALQVLKQPRNWGELSLEVLHLLFKIALYLSDRSRFEEAEAIYGKALALQERVLCSHELERAQILEEWANLSWRQQKEAQASMLYQQARELYEQRLGQDHPQRASLLENLSRFQCSQNNYAEAKQCGREALQIWSKLTDAPLLQVARVCDTLAHLCWLDDQLAEAVVLKRQALQLREHLYKEDHPDLVLTLHSLGHISASAGSVEEADTLFQQAFSMRERCLARSSPDSLKDYVDFYQMQCRHQNVDYLVRQVLAIWEIQAESPAASIALRYRNLARYYAERGKDERAAFLEEHARSWERNMPDPTSEKMPEKPSVFTNSSSLSACSQASSVSGTFFKIS